jgi:hypothetical protein
MRALRLRGGSRTALAGREQLPKFPQFLPIIDHPLAQLEGRAGLG